MVTAPRHRLSRLDRVLSRDRRLAAVLDLFPTPALARELVESPARSAAATRVPGVRLPVASPEVIAVAAVAVLATCAIVGGLLGNVIVVLAGLGATILLGIACHVAIRRLVADHVAG